MRMRLTLLAILAAAAPVAADETKRIYLQDGDGARIEIATLAIADGGSYKIALADAAFSDHFLSMRPFKCLDGPEKTWCHVPYPYEIRRNIGDGLTDLEYDLLFVWKRSNEYGIDMWNGVYYRLAEDGGRLTGTLHEMNMDVLSAPPPKGELRPIKPADLHESDPESHWLPTLIAE